MKKLYSLLLYTSAMVMVTACDTVERVHANDTIITMDAPDVTRECDRFYDSEEDGFTTRCFDVYSDTCYTLYEPDGDTEYYCGDVKIWEYEPEDAWDGWDFAAGAALATVLKPKVVSNKTKPTSTRPYAATTTVSKPKSKTKPKTTTVSKPKSKPKKAISRKKTKKPVKKRK